MFVDKKHHKKGIARQLFDVVLKEIKLDKSIRQVTVNSSPYAVEIYKSLGFEQLDEVQEIEGILYIPMISYL